MDKVYKTGARIFFIGFLLFIGLLIFIFAKTASANYNYENYIQGNYSISSSSTDAGTQFFYSNSSNYASGDFNPRVKYTSSTISLNPASYSPNHDDFIFDPGLYQISFFAKGNNFNSGDQFNIYLFDLINLNNTAIITNSIDSGCGSQVSISNGQKLFCSYNAMLNFSTTTYLAFAFTRPSASFSRSFSLNYQIYKITTSTAEQTSTSTFSIDLTNIENNLDSFQKLFIFFFSVSLFFAVGISLFYVIKPKW